MVALCTSERAEMGFRILLLASATGATRAAAAERRVEKRMVALRVGGVVVYPGRMRGGCSSRGKAERPPGIATGRKAKLGRNGREEMEAM